MFPQWKDHRCSVEWVDVKYMAQLLPFYFSFFLFSSLHSCVFPVNLKPLGICPYLTFLKVIKNNKTLNSYYYMLFQPLVLHRVNSFWLSEELMLNLVLNDSCGISQTWLRVQPVSHVCSLRVCLCVCLKSLFFCLLLLPVQLLCAPLGVQTPILGITSIAKS